MTNVLKAVKARQKRKEEKRSGGGHSRYGPLAVQLSNGGAIAHKALCEPACFFTASSAQLAPIWSFFKAPPPKSKRCASPSYTK